MSRMLIEDEISRLEARAARTCDPREKYFLFQKLDLQYRRNASGETYVEAKP